MLELSFILLGSFFCWIAWSGWKHRKEERISLIEAAILKTTGVEPLPLTKVDRALQTFQLVMASIFGPTLLLLGILFITVGD